MNGIYYTKESWGEIFTWQEITKEEFHQLMMDKKTDNQDLKICVDKNKQELVWLKRINK
jgi:hypothetical protein